MNILIALAHIGPIAGLGRFSVMAASIACVGAGISMTMLQLKMRQRYRMMEERTAKSLVEGLRKGVLDFDSPSRGDQCNIFWSEPEEIEETQLQLMPSRYQLLGYPRQLPAARLKELPAPSRILGVRLLGPGMSAADENVLRGVPKAYLAESSLHRGRAWESEDTESFDETDGITELTA